MTVTSGVKEVTCVQVPEAPELTSLPEGPEGLPTLGMVSIGHQRCSDTKGMKELIPTQPPYRPQIGS